LFKRWGNGGVADEWLFVHAHGDYEYRNPDSVYVHRWETFATKDDALDWLDRCVAKVTQPEWKLYRAAVDA